MILFFCALMIFGNASSYANDPGIMFVVNAQNPFKTISKEDLVDFYNKAKRRWPDGTEVRFVDRSVGTSARQEFLANVLQESENDADQYWFEQKFHTGSSAPIQVSSDDLVIEIIRSFKGAIGYISSSTSLEGKQIKPIKVSSSTTR